MDVLPHQNDSRAYCEVCKRGFAARRNYSRHINTTAHKRMLQQSSVSTDMPPYEYDPNNYCEVCNQKLRR